MSGILFFIFASYHPLRAWFNYQLWVTNKPFELNGSQLEKMNKVDSLHAHAMKLIIMEEAVELKSSNCP